MTRHEVDPVGLSWLITVRWTAVLAAAAAIAFGSRALHLGVHAPEAGALLLASAGSNLWLAHANRSGSAGRAVAGALVSSDVLVLTWCLIDAGGIVNPASIFFLVDIVVAALVLGPAWTWAVTALSIAGYGVQLFFRTPDLAAALAMHPQIAEHVRGMWLAFLGSAILIATLVARLATAVDRRDRALADLRADAERTARLASLATLTAGAAHELSTPLGSIAVAAGELAHALDRGSDAASLRSDVALIRDEVARCKRILDAMSGRAAEDDPPAAASLRDLAAAVIGGLSEPDRSRVAVSSSDATVVWPVRSVARAVHNVVKNALDASPTSRVRVEFAHDRDEARVTVADDGPGMAPADLARAGDPFYTTKAGGSGMGLGLFVSRTTIEHLGGRFTLASTPAAGTVVTLSLPSSLASAAS